MSRARHVAGWVHFESTILDVPDDVVRELQLRLDAMNRDRSSWTEFQAGQTVYVTTKLFESLAEVADDSVSSQGRIKVFLEFMGRLVPALVPWTDLQTLETEPPLSLKSSNRRTRGRGRWIRGREPVTGTAA